MMSTDGEYVIVVASCIACSRTITPNPNYCPSISVKGSREPICKSCFNLWNKIHRTDKGLEPEELHPLAYKPARTDEL